MIENHFWSGLRNCGYESTYLIVDKQKRFSTFRVQNKLNYGLTPDMFSVKSVNAITWLYLCRQFVLFSPLFILLDPFRVPHLFFFTFFSCQFWFIWIFCLDHQLDCSVDYFAFGQGTCSNFFSAIWALLFPNQRLLNANVTETVTADSCATLDYVVHTYRTI